MRRSIFISAHALVHMRSRQKLSVYGSIEDSGGRICFMDKLINFPLIRRHPSKNRLTRKKYEQRNLKTKDQISVRHFVLAPNTSHNPCHSLPFFFKKKIVLYFTFGKSTTIFALLLVLLSCLNRAY